MAFWASFRRLIGLRSGAAEPAATFTGGAQTLHEDFDAYRRDPLPADRPSPLKERARAMRAVEAGRGGFNQPIVGESYCQDVLQRVKADAFIEIGGVPIVTFLLIREPENLHDPNAIAVLTEDGDVVGYLSREHALLLQPTALEHEKHGEVLSCDGKLIGDDLIGVWLNLPHLIENRTPVGALSRGEQLEKYGGLDICRDVSNVANLIADRTPYSRSRPDWAGSRIATIGEERYTANLERVSKGRCERGERINLKVFLVPDTANTIDPHAVMVTTATGDVLGYLERSHAARWADGIQGCFAAGRVVSRNASLHQRTFKSGKRTFYVSVDMTDAEWLADAADRLA